MARVGDLPKVIRSVGLVAFSRRVWKEVNDDSLFTLAAAVAYSWLFAIFPFLIFLLSLLSYLPAEVKEEVRIFLNSSLPDEAARTIWDNITQIVSRPRTGLMGIGLLLTLWGASGGMNMTVTALETCYEIEQGRSFVRKRAVALGLTIITAVLVVTVLALLPLGTLGIHWLEKKEFPFVSSALFQVWRVARYPLALYLMFMILNILYYYGPSIRQRFVFATPGAMIAVLAWMLLGLAFRLYINKFGRYNETYGTVGGVAILLLVFYFDALVLLVGAEINSEIDFEVLGVPRGSRDFTKAAAT